MKSYNACLIAFFISLFVVVNNVYPFSHETEMRFYNGAKKDPKYTIRVANATWADLEITWLDCRDNLPCVASTRNTEKVLLPAGKKKEFFVNRALKLTLRATIPGTSPLVSVDLPLGMLYSSLAKDQNKWLGTQELSSQSGHTYYIIAPNKKSLRFLKSATSWGAANQIGTDAFIQ